jgi:hypothetical protein
VDTPRPSPRTNRTRRVPHPVLHPGAAPPALGWRCWRGRRALPRVRARGVASDRSSRRLARTRALSCAQSLTLRPNQVVFELEDAARLRETSPDFVAIIRALAQ